MIFTVPVLPPPPIEIVGPGAGSTGAGIHILPGATNVFVGGGRNGVAFNVSGFNIGILDEGSWATVSAFFAFKNLTAGVFLKGVTGSAFSDFAASDNAVNGNNRYGVYLLNTTSSTLVQFLAAGNGVYGVWLQSSSNNKLHEFASEQNGIAGVYLGSSPNGTFGFRSPSPGSGNWLYSDVSPINTLLSRTDSNNTGGIGYGVVIDKGETKNRVIGLASGTNDTYDLFDLNRVCDRNLWFGNTFDPGKAFPSCVN